MRKLIFLIAFSLLSISIAAQCNTNVIVITMDDLGNNDLKYSTPYIDTLMEEGAYMSNFYVQAKCTATRASILTGMYAQNYHPKLWDALSDPDPGGLADTAITIAERLKETGYETALFGKWHLGHDVADYHPMDHGFTRYWGYQYGEIGQFSYISRNGYNGVYDDRNLVALQDSQEFYTDTVTDKTIDFIEANTDNPFFIYLNYPSPHVPLMSRNDEVQRYLTNGTRGWDVITDVADPARAYQEMIEQTDENIGRIYNSLKEQGISDNTVIIFLGDNGGGPSSTDGNTVYADNSPFRGKKQEQWDGGIHVPAFIRWPNRITQDTISEYIHCIDLYNTLLEITGLPADTDRDGTSFLRTALHSAPMPDRYLYFALANTDIHAMIETSTGYKITRMSGNTGLYFLPNDPGEGSDLSVTESAKFSQMQTDFATWSAQFY